MAARGLPEQDNTPPTAPRQQRPLLGFAYRKAGYTAPMPRAILVLVIASIAFACALTFGASIGRTGASATRVLSGTRTAAADPGIITLRLRYRRGLWKTSLSLKLVKTRLISFSICAIRNYQAGQKYDCDLDRGAGLSGGMTMRLEQNPVAKALSRADSPGWGMLGVSITGRLGAVLSNTVTGDKFGTFRYRVTLRDSSGKVLATSNPASGPWVR